MASQTALANSRLGQALPNLQCSCTQLTVGDGLMMAIGRSDSPFAVAAVTIGHGAEHYCGQYGQHHRLHPRTWPSCANGKLATRAASIGGTKPSVIHRESLLIHLSTASHGSLSHFRGRLLCAWQDLSLLCGHSLIALRSCESHKTSALPL